MESVKIKDLLEYISGKLQGLDEFKKYTFSKNNKILTYKVNDGCYRIELNTYKSYDHDRNEVSNEIIPYYYRSWDILHGWFKKHTALSISDFNSRASVFVSGSFLGFEENFHFLVTNQDFQKDIQNFTGQLIKTEQAFLKKFETLEDLYKFQALPIVNNKDFKFELHADEDLFTLLRLVYMVAPQNFEELNNRVYKHFLFARDEYESDSALLFIPRYDEIIADLKKI